MPAIEAMPTQIQSVFRVRLQIPWQTCAAWLERHNSNNRPFIETHWMALALDMLEGRWEYNGDAIRFAADGTLLDGQHRLKAAVEAKMPLDADVVFGLPKQARRTIDIGSVRSAAHIAAMEGITNSAITTAAARLLLLHKRHGIARMNNPRLMPTKTAVNAAAASLPQLQEVASKTAGITKAKAFIAPRILCFCYYLFRKQNPEKADAFFQELNRGTDLKTGDPVYKLRERLLNQGKQKLPALEVIALFFRAWIAYRSGRLVKCLKPTIAEAGFPDIGPVEY